MNRSKLLDRFYAQHAYNNVHRHHDVDRLQCSACLWWQPRESEVRCWIPDHWPNCIKNVIQSCRSGWTVLSSAIKMYRIQSMCCSSIQSWANCDRRECVVVCHSRVTLAIKCWNRHSSPSTSIHTRCRRTFTFSITYCRRCASNGRAKRCRSPHNIRPCGSNCGKIIGVRKMAQPTGSKPARTLWRSIGMDNRPPYHSTSTMVVCWLVTLPPRICKVWRRRLHWAPNVCWSGNKAVGKRKRQWPPAMRENRWHWRLHILYRRATWIWHTGDMWVRMCNWAHRSYTVQTMANPSVRFSSNENCNRRPYVANSIRTHRWGACMNGRAAMAGLHTV